MRSAAIFAFTLTGIAACAQSVATRSSEFEINMSETGKTVNAVVPVITWISPENDNIFQEETTLQVKMSISSTSPIESITIGVKNKLSSSKEQELNIDAKPNSNSTLEFDVELAPGANVLEITVETVDHIRGLSRKTVHVGSVNLADAYNLSRTDYALVFATDQYDHWPDLVNPIFDGKAIAVELKNTYGYKVEVVENATQDEILRKLREYIGKQYQPLDQLFIFFAGHGTYDQTFSEGYLVPREALIKDEAKTSYLSYNRLRSVVNNIPCEHIFLAMDVCFGGSFDEELDASSGLEESNFTGATAAEFVTRKLSYKTRRFMTSGEKQYVSDGIPGQHSPFARAVLEGLRSSGGSDGILTLRELTPHVAKLKIKPRVGEFGDNAPGSDFVFVSR